MAKSKRQRQKLETKSSGISNISGDGLDDRPTGTRDRLFHRFSFPALELPLAHCRF